MGNVKLYVYRVGHGLCTLLHAKKAVGTYNAVFDCGSLQLMPEACNGYPLPLDESIAHMAEIIREGGNDHLDLLVSSHQDIDHNSMFYNLINALNGWDQEYDGWIDCGNDGLVKTGERARMEIRSIPSTDSAMYVYEYHDGVSVGFKQLISGGGRSYLKNVEKFKAQQTVRFEWKAEDKDGSSEYEYTFGIGFGLTIKEMMIDRCWQSSVSGCTQIKISISQRSGLSLQCMISINSDKMSLDLWCSELAKESGKVIEKELIGRNYGNNYVRSVLKQQYVNWVNFLYVNFIKNENVFFQGKEIAKIIQSKRHIPRPKFKLYSVVMGGYSDKEPYRALINTLHVYKDTFSRASDYARMTVSVYPKYTYMQCEIDVDPIICIAENTVYSKEISEGAVNASDPKTIRYNATSTVVNFVYRRDASEVYSVLFPGDVTAHHHNDIAEKIRKSGLKVTHIIAPHHGSYDTNILINPVTNKQFADQYQPLYALYSSLHSATTIISECYNNFKHSLPRGEFIQIAEQSARQSSGHTLSWFCSASGGIVREKEDTYTKGVFTTGECRDFNKEITIVDLEECGISWDHFIRGGSAAKADISEHADMPKSVLPPAYLFV